MYSQTLFSFFGGTVVCSQTLMLAKLNPYLIIFQIAPFFAHGGPQTMTALPMPPMYLR
jgi:hypothetical protein